MRSFAAAALALAAVCIAPGCDGARTLESSGAAQCTECHGTPPPPFVTGATTHPASTACNLCHSTTVDAGGNLIAGGPHLNGTVDVTAHELPFVAQHTGPALSDIGACAACHGADYSGGISNRSCTACHETDLGFADWQTNCTFCHGTRTPGWTAPLRLAAPPEGVLGETAPSDPHVGAHQKHLGNGSTISDGVACTECHAVPSGLAHLDGTALLTWGPLAQTGGATPAWTPGTLTCASTYCHGAGLDGGANTSPSWTATVACGDCHGSPPDTGGHTAVIAHAGQPCSRCHVQVATNTALPGIVDSPTAKALHVNGAKDVSLSVSGTWDGTAKTCSNVACHGTSGARNW
jgi:predicted CxxxxCH...CXXCH cytochrome family protein